MRRVAQRPDVDRIESQRARELGDAAPVLEAAWPRVSVFAVHTSVSPAPPEIRAFTDLARQAAAEILER